MAKVMEMVESNLGKTVIARLLEDEDLLDSIAFAAKKSHVDAGFFMVIGTLKKANVGFYRERKYETITIDGPLEIVSCIGNIALKEKAPFVHAHIAVSNEKGEVLGGHVMAGCTIAATGELVLVEAKDGKLFRELDEKTNLFLLAFGE